MKPKIKALVEKIAPPPASGQPFEIRSKGNREADVLIYGDIGGWDEESVHAAQFVRDLQAIEADTINVRINSYGGSVKDAQGIYTALTRHPATIHTHIDGMAVSAASLIAMAGDKIVMPQNALMMIHGPSAMAAGNAQTMREAADTLDRFATAMAPCYARKSGKPAGDMLAMLTDGKDHWYSAEEAKAAGFADEISDAVEVTASFDLRRFNGVPAAAAAFSRSTTMPDNIPAAPTPAAPQPTAAAPAAPVPTPQPVATAPVLAVVPTSGRTKEQNAEIRAAFAPFMQRDGISDVYTTVLEDPAITVEAARQQLLTALGKDASPATPTAHHVQMGETDGEKFRAACTIAIVARAGFASVEERKTLGQNPHRAAKLLDMARASLERIGINTRGMDQREIVAQAFTQSTSDFPILLEQTVNKTLLSAYQLAPDTWRRFAAKGSVSDFRPHTRYWMGSFSNLDAVGEGGEFKNKPINDGSKQAISATTKGNIVNLTRQAIINDDIGAFTGIAAALGRAAKRSIEADVYALLNLNNGLGPTMSDGVTLFHADHGNLASSGAVPAVATLSAARLAMAAQMDPSGNDYLDIRPKTFVGGTAYEDTMKIMNGAVYDPTALANKAQSTIPNVVAGLVDDIVTSPRIAGTDWYIFGDSQVAPVIEVVFLDGNEEPFTETMKGWDVDGTAWKVRLDYGVGAIDWRGAYANPGS